MSGNELRWWKQPKGQAHKHAMQTAQDAEQDLGGVFQRIFLLECLYDPHNPEADNAKLDRVTENAIASNVDTVSAVIASTDIRARYMTDGADWKTQRTARRLEWYSEDLQTTYDVLPKCRRAFKGSAKVGKGLVKVHAVHRRPSVEYVPLKNVVVPPDECRDGREAMQLHHWEYIDADELTARFPKHEEAIERARKRGTSRRMQWGTNNSFLSNDVECLWSYRKPVGVKPFNWRKGMAGYMPGRVTLSIADETLLDEEVHEDHFPFGEMTWSEREDSFYPISGAERIMGIQRALNKRNWQIEAALDRIAAPTVYVRPADANLATKANKVGTVAVIRGEEPKSFAPIAVSGETYKSRIDLREAAQQEFGQTSMATHGAKPPGIDSGVAMREFKDQTTQRFASQEQAFEALVLQVNFLLLEVCKKLGKDAPKVTRRTRFGAQTIAWKDVDLGTVKVQMKAAANLNRTPAGRMQLVIEFAQAGIISTDQARKLLQHPDLEREISLYTSALESIEHDLDAIADGNIVAPEPYSHHSMCVWRGQREYLIWRDDGAPEEILEALRDYLVQAAWLVSQAQQPANTNMPAAGADPMAQAGAMPPAAPMPGPMPVDAAMPGAAQPAAALATQAMQTRAA